MRNPSSAQHAVVIGGSIAGLLAARVLSDTYARVTVFDRDDLPATPQHRRGVPQSRHTHGLLARGFEIFEELFPGLGEDLREHGALVDDMQRGVLWFNDGHQVRRARSGLTVLLASRTMLEWYLRERVGALANVDIVAGTEVAGLLSSGDRLTGVRISDTVDVAADLVVDASGRSNRGPAWLAELGYPAVAEDIVRANLVYVTREYRHVPGEQDFTGIIHSHYPDNPVGGGTLATDGRRWIVTMLGMGDDHPSLEPGQFEQFAKRLAGTELYDLITTAEPLTDPTRFRIGPSARRRYDRAKRLPEGFLVIGDALCCFNPAYGQGMTSAAMTAIWLRSCLRAGTQGLTRRYFGGVRKIIDVPWAITVGNDLRFPSVEGRRTVQMRVLNAYLARLHRASVTDAVVGRAFLRVANFMAPPPSLLAPAMLWRVWRGQKRWNV